ncbi:hypothetical protein KAFR_0F00520 [Kazachstania africana CBS 2517]|uniref:non-specific serine/threonine protein kinase n=1 Tax=Kazachstania africana (strain ATCC 22294 / BCRC 22015 / CBS 2517 / CECT 1963 / NBRC 1671 / NRRL Y-8276) TaxID=1071382 RepID=H2AW99_KAZAF|nr:hypothetical protein KAFR_0F00520 [Kazachstania africana CBS 2517]CCF58649.1 hypothetical protein KAFR_0F00520 [Kazachstania africana CBS 2517]
MKVNTPTTSTAVAASAANTMAMNQLMNQSRQNYDNISSASSSNYNANSSNDSTIVGLHYKIGKKIGEGSFGVIFEGVNMINGAPVAIKFEPRKTEAPQLKDEYRTYKILTGSKNIPMAYYFGQEGLHNILVIDLLGPSLEDLFEWCGRKFSIKTVVQVAVQMISLLEELHNHDLIYRDIKPDNFLIGRPGQSDANEIHLIDLGMAKQYRDPKTKQHIPYREKKSLSGTARYMSINTHLGREQSRRDDMESLGHVFFYFLRGQLPWQGLKAPNNKLKYEKIGEKKRSTNVYDLAQGLPVQFGRYLEIVRNLSFDETPDYDGYRKLIFSVLDDLNLAPDGQYDWMKLNGGRGWDLSINRKPNLHGYGHPTPPNDKSRKHRTNKQLQPLQVPPTQQQQAPLPQPPQPPQPYDKLDPNSYEAYQQQIQQRYIKQQNQLRLKQQQQQMQQQQLHAQQQQQLQRQQQQLQQNRYVMQQDPTRLLSQQEQAARHVNNTNKNYKQNSTNDSVSENQGFFSKFACC